MKNKKFSQFGSTNEERAHRAHRALVAYIGDDRPDESHLSDLLCDLQHYAGRAGLNFEAELDRGTSCYADERREELESPEAIYREAIDRIRTEPPDDVTDLKDRLQRCILIAQEAFEMVERLSHDEHSQQERK